MEQLAVIDKVLRFVKEVDSPFGGALFIACGDHFQLRPISGTPCWNSPLLVSACRIIPLQHLVRCIGDQGKFLIFSLIILTNIHLSSYEVFYQFNLNVLSICDKHNYFE